MITKEIKVKVFSGDLSGYILSENGYSLMDKFSQTNGFTVQRFDYSCEMKRDEVYRTYGASGNVIVKFSIRVMDSEQILFYEKIKDTESDFFSFVFNGKFDAGRLKTFDNAIVVEGFVVDVYETGSNDVNQALMNVTILATELRYVHTGGTTLTLKILNHK